MGEIEGLHGAAMVTRGGSVEMLWAGGPTGGTADSHCTPDTRFQIASMSKQFTAAATMALVEAGILDLFEPVERWLPGSPAHWRPITLHHLLSHTAGVPHWGDAPGLVPTDTLILERRIALIQEASLLSAPGTRWHYSSPGFLVVGHIVALASRQPYGEFLKACVLDRIGMGSTTVGNAAPAGLTAHGFRDGRPVDPWDLAEMPGTGDICSTVGDMARYNTALHGGSLLGPQSLDTMSTVHAPLDDDSDVLTTVGYGYGMYLGTARGHTVLYHTGDNPGFKSFNAWIPDAQASVVILSNDESDDIEGVVAQLLDIVAR